MSHILVVETETFFRKALVSVVEALGHYTIETNNAHEAILVLGLHVCNTVLLDLRANWDTLTFIRTITDEFPAVNIIGVHLDRTQLGNAFSHSILMKQVGTALQCVVEGVGKPPVVATFQ